MSTADGHTWKSRFQGSIWATSSATSVPQGIALFLNPSQPHSEEASPLEILLSALCVWRLVFTWEWVAGLSPGLTTEEELHTPALGFLSLPWQCPCSGGVGVPSFADVEDDLAKH